MIVLFGGSFNPVHIGHIAAVQMLSTHAEIKQIVILPTKQSPFKAADQYLPLPLRWTMLQAALQSTPKTSVWDIEMWRLGPCFSYQSIQTLRSLFPSTPLALACGKDAFDTLDTWKHHTWLKHMAQMMVFERNLPSPTDNTLMEKNAAQVLSSPSNPPNNPLSKQASSKTPIKLSTPAPVMFLKGSLPVVSSAEIRRTRNLNEVPEAARPLLADYWNHQ